MSMELDSRHINHQLDTEIISAEMMDEAVTACFPAIDNAPERALEIVTPFDTPACETDAVDECDDAPEVETAEEISLKNGVYHEIRRKLGERFNIPATEVAFIHEADSPAKKAALFKAVNSGKVRVLIGSTSKLGTGVNVQKRLIALHHVDEPWKPAELEQREGRILRQGNIYPEAFIFHYVTERSFDGYMLQTLESKARFISQIMAGEVTARTAEDVGDMVLTVAQVKAIASGNPMVQERIELEVKLVKLDRLRAAFYNNRAAMRADLEELPDRIAAQEAELCGHEEASRARQPLAEDAFRITIKRNLGEAESTTFDKRERAGAHLRHLSELLMDHIRRGVGNAAITQEVGSYRGFQVFVRVSGNSRFAGHSTLFNYNAEIHLRAPNTSTIYVAQIGESNVGITQSIDYQLRHLEDRVEQTRSGIEMLQARLSIVQAEVDKPWMHATQYARLRRRYDEMGKALQSQGIEIESNTTFTNEEEGSVEISEPETIPTKEAASELPDEVAARSNPFTGFEDFPIIVEETGEFGITEGDEQERSNDKLLSFDFEASDVTLPDEAIAGNFDIFSNVPQVAEISNEVSLESASGKDSERAYSSETNKDDEDEEEAMWQIAESRVEAGDYYDHKSRKPRSKQAGKAKLQTENSQIGFLW